MRTAGPPRLRLFLLYLLGVLSSSIHTGAAAGPGSRANGVIEERTSAYNHIVIYREGTELAMAFRGSGSDLDQSRIRPGHPDQLVLAYTRVMMAGLLYVEQPRSLLMLGLGGGTMTTYLRRHLPALDISAVELDPAVTELARKYFSLSEDERYRVYTADARAFLEQHPEPRDLILADVFRADSYIPRHLLTQEFFRLARDRLRPGGCLVLNLHPNNPLFDATVLTLRSVFTTVDSYLAEGNVILVAADGTGLSPARLRARAAARQRRYHLPHDLRALPALRTGLRVGGGAWILRDEDTARDGARVIEEENRSGRYQGTDLFSTENKSVPW